jgi:hypothetical protein
MVELEVFVRLPQATLRMLGLPNINVAEVYQVRSARYNLLSNRDRHEYEETCAVFNRAALSGLCRTFQVIEASEICKFRETKSTKVFESNLLNHIEAQVLQKITFDTFDYASSLMAPTYHDLISSPIGFGRSIVRNYAFSKKYRGINIFWDWTTIQCEREPNFFKPWFWKSKRLSKELFDTHIDIYIENVKSISELFKRFYEEPHKTVIITDADNYKDLSKILELLLSSNPNFSSNVRKKYPIFIKSRRDNFQKIKELKFDQFFGCKVYCSLELIDSLVPAELFYLNLEISQETLIFGELGSIWFNGFANEMIGLQSKKDPLFVQQSGYLTKRFRRELPNFIW